jgi:hypothetical protein
VTETGSTQIPKFGLVLVLVVVLVLGALGFRDRKETDVLQLICSVSLIAKRILEDEDDDEHEDDSSNSEFRLSEPWCFVHRNLANRCEFATNSRFPKTL